MICRVALFQWEENSKEAAEACADQMVKVYAEQEGFVSATFIGHYDRDIYGTATLWQSVDDANKVDESLRAKFMELVGNRIVGIVEQSQLDVYEPKE